VKRPYLAMIIGCGVLGAHAQVRTEPHTAAEWMERGKVELKRAYYRDAESAFRKAIALTPDSASAHVLLARALIGELLPNLGMFPDTDGILPKAEQAVNRALELSPENLEALCVSGIVNYKTAQSSRDPRQQAQHLNRARAAFDRALLLNPRSLEAHFELARMESDTALNALIQAQLRSGKPVKQGPLADPELRHLLQRRYSAAIEDALAHTRTVLDIDPGYERAFGQMAGLFMARAQLQDDNGEYEVDMKVSEDWRSKEAAAIAVRRSKIPEQQSIGGIIGAVPSSAPPPPPPPPRVVP
jgi:tetratricopeptide (TPR) repeat protein